MRRQSLHRVVGARKPRWLLSGAAISLLGYTALAVLAAGQQMAAVDYGVRTWVALLRYQMLNLPMRVLTGLGESAGLLPLIALGMVVLWRRQRRWAIALPFLMAGAGALQYVTKWAAQRPRPNDAPWGFPSGHVLTLVVFFGLMIWLIATASRRRRWWRILAGAVCTATVLSVAFTRLYLDKHWLSDLAGGLMAGMAYLLLAIWVVEVCMVDRRGPAPPPPGTTG
ncbi:MAG TPA: phosphatase PAP2 family protein [Methylomirabilota bacterium]|nr:phosphatase PAP2 family protein [Methylomirabilota bacterium]